MMNTPHHLQPPPYISNTIVSRMYRFQYVYTNNGTLQSFIITPAKLGALQVIGTTANTSATQLYEAVRVRRIEMWSSSPTDGSIIDISCVFPGIALGIQGPDKAYSAQTIGMTRPAYLSAVPGRNSQTAQWQGTTTNFGTNTMFTLGVTGTGSSGTVTVTCDVHLALRMTQDTRTTNNTVTLTTVVLTGHYYLALDNPAGATGAVGNVWIPDRNLVTTS